MFRRISQRLTESVRCVQDVTTRASHYVRDNNKRHSSSSATARGRLKKRDCKLETGNYLSPRDSCQTYSVFGRLPPLDAFQRSVVCLRPGRLTHMFDVSNQLPDPASIFVDKTIKYVQYVAPVFIIVQWSHRTSRRVTSRPFCSLFANSSK